MVKANRNHGVASGPVGLALRASSVENQRLRAIIERLRADSTTDCLTGLANRRALDGRLAELWSGSVRHGHDLACVALDIDGLKRVNDTLGHAAGDELIRVAAETLRVCVRGSDFVARTGGDEFVALLPMTGLAGGRLLAERIVQRFLLDTTHLRARLDEHPTNQVRVVIAGRRGRRTNGPSGDGRSDRIGISAGVSTRMDDACPSARALLEAADARLYEAKKARASGAAIRLAA